MFLHNPLPVGGYFWLHKRHPGTVVVQQIQRSYILGLLPSMSSLYVSTSIVHGPDNLNACGKFLRLAFLSLLARRLPGAVQSLPVCSKRPCWLVCRRRYASSSLPRSLALPGSATPTSTPCSSSLSWPTRCWTARSFVSTVHSACNRRIFYFRQINWDHLFSLHFCFMWRLPLAGFLWLLCHRNL